MAKTKKPLHTFTLKGHSVHLDTKGLKCIVTDYKFDCNLLVKEPKFKVKIKHNLPKGVFSDATFEKEITAFLKKDNPRMRIKEVVFSELGLQKNKLADMEVLFKS